MRSTPIAHRSGVTLIELMIAVIIMVILMSLAVPSMSEALARSRVSNAANMIQEAHRQARALARRTGPPTPTSPVNGQFHYGVLVTGDYVAVTYGSTASVATILEIPAGKPVARFTFPTGVVATDSATNTALSASGIGWLYTYDGGYPVTDTSYTVPVTPADPTGRVVNIGVAGSPVCTELTVRTVDSTTRGRHHAGVRIFKTGPCHVDLQ